MRPNDPSRRLLRVGLKFAPRVLVGAVALLSLLLTYQVIWTAVRELTWRVVSPRLWLVVNDDYQYPKQPPSLTRRVEPVRFTQLPLLPVDAIGPHDAHVELFLNGRPTNLTPVRRGRRSANLPLRKGPNFVVATATVEGGIVENRLLEIRYNPPSPSQSWILASVSPYGPGVVDLGFADPDTKIVLPNGRISVSDRLGSLMMSAVRQPAERAPPEDAAGPQDDFPDAVRTRFVDSQRRLARDLSFTVGRDQLSVHAIATIPERTELYGLVSTFSIGELLRNVFGVCVEIHGVWPEGTDPLATLRCYVEPTQPLTDDRMFLQIDADGRLVASHDFKLPRRPLTVRYQPQTSLAQVFPMFPDDRLRLQKQGDATVQIKAVNYEERDGEYVWNAHRKTIGELQYGPLFVVGEEPRAPDADRAPPAGDAGNQGGDRKRLHLNDQIRKLEALVPKRLQPFIGRLVSAIPFLYLLWILHVFPVGPRAHVATIRAVTLTFLILHLSVVAVTLFDELLTGQTIRAIAYFSDDARWSRAVAVLYGSSYLRPFLAVGIVFMVRPVFRALRWYVLERPDPRAAGTAGWVLFWVAVFSVPIVTAWMLAKLEWHTAPDMSRWWLGVAMLPPLAAAWILLLWIFRGVFRIRLQARAAIRASWAMLLLPLAPTAADGLHELLRALIAIHARIYPFMLSRRPGPYLATAIIVILGAVLLRQTGDLSVRLSQNRKIYRWWRLHRAEMLAAALVISIPVTANFAETDVFELSDFLYDLDLLLPYALLGGIAVLVRLYNPGDRFDLPPALIQIGALLFAWYVTRGGAMVLFIPLPFLMAWLLFRHWLMAPRPQIAPTTGETVGAYLEEQRARSRLESLQRGLDKKFSEGELKLADYDARLQEGQTAVAAAARALDAAGGGSEVRVFANGPEGSPWANARIALIYGMVISAPFQMLTLVRMMSLGWGGGSFPLLEFSFALLYSVITWAVMAGVFGYFFHVIRGRNGFEKALWFSLCVILPAIPLRLVIGESIFDRGQVLNIVQVVAFTLVLALLAFDLRTLQKHRYGWRDLMTVYGLASAAYGSTLAIAIVSALGGKDIVANLWTFIKSLATG